MLQMIATGIRGIPVMDWDNDEEGLSGQLIWGWPSFQP